MSREAVSICVKSERLPLVISAAAGEHTQSRRGPLEKQRLVR